MSETPPAFKILAFLYNAYMDVKNKVPDTHYFYDDFELAEELGLDMRKARKLLKGLKRLGMVSQHTTYRSWCFRGGPTFKFLNGVSGEFTQDMLREGLGVSRPTASRRMRLLSDLNLIEVSRIEAIPKTGGRRLWFRRA